jgi:hypothetical protein
MSTSGDDTDTTLAPRGLADEQWRRFTEEEKRIIKQWGAHEHPSLMSPIMRQPATGCCCFSESMISKQPTKRNNKPNI